MNWLQALSHRGIIYSQHVMDTLVRSMIPRVSVLVAISIFTVSLFSHTVFANQKIFSQNGDLATTTATLTFDDRGVIATETSQVTIKVVFEERLDNTPSVIRFFEYNETETVNIFSIPKSEFSTDGELSGTFVKDENQLNIPDGGDFSISGIADDTLNIPLTETNSYATGDPVFVQLTDLDQNSDPLIKEQVIVTLGTNTGDDEEVIVLYETGVNTGIFMGYIITRYTTESSYNGVLSVLPNTEISANYIDRFDNSDTSATAALIDPFGLIFNSENGNAINGVEITIINATTDLPADVFSPDGVTKYPSTITTGTTVTDAGGNTYELTDGSYYFPLLAPGDYRFQITIPDGYFDAPSEKTDAELRLLPNGDEFALGLGSRLETFTLEAGPALKIDVPIDPIPTQPFISKKANKSSASLGDFVQFSIDVTNPSLIESSADDIIIDTLPVGFRYVSDSLYINDVIFENPVISTDGRIIEIPLSAVESEATANIRYVTQVTAGTPLGESVNIAQLQTQLEQPQVAQASILIVEDLFRSKSILMGRVIWDDCESTLDSPAEMRPGVENVRIYMEDGTFVNTDSDGRWHIEGVTPGTHVVQLDVDSLPDNLEVVECHASSRRAGTPFSEFVDVQGGTLWRTDFYLKEISAPLGHVNIEQTMKTRKRWKIDLKLNFAHDSSKLKPAFFAEINTLAQYMNQHPESTVIIAGHTSSLGSDKYNFKLSQRRAQSIEKVLIRKFNIDQSRLMSKGYGETKPINVANNEQAHRENRRIEAIISDNSNGSSAQRRINIAVDVDVSLSAESIGDLNQVALNYLPPKGWTILHNAVDVDGKSTQASRITHNNIEYVSLALDKQLEQTVQFTLTPTTQIDEDVDYRGKGRAFIRYKAKDNKHVSDEAQSNTLTTKANDINLSELVQKDETIAHVTSSNVEQFIDNDYAKASNSINSELILGRTLSKEQLLESKQSTLDVNTEPGILSLSDGQFISRETVAIRFQLDSRLSPQLLIDGKQVSDDRQAYKSVDSETRLTVYNYIGVSIGDEGKHTISLNGVGPFGNARFSEEIIVERTGEVQKLRLLESKGNVADGETPIKIQLGLLDNHGNHIPAEVKLSLENSDLTPYQSEYDRKVLEQVSNQLTMKPDGTVLFNPVAQAGLYTAEIRYDDNISEKIKFYVKPFLREWILVGFAEGTVGYNNLSGNREALTANDFEDDLYRDGQVKFYAKGKVKGDWLLTMAYDTTKREDDQILNQTITPGAYYTLYGDASRQEHDAASRKKLYLRIEKDQYYALFGDFTTGLNEGELTSYNRSLTGVKAEYNGEQYNVTLFAAETDQAYVRDEIQGEGTSGLYNLSNQDIVSNSETISIEVRDRFQSQDIIEERQLSRFVDYTIDYIDGSIYFKQPIYSVDRQNNPIYIVAEYETESDVASDDLVAGGRVGITLPGINDGDAGELGITHINEGDSGRSGSLTGLDLTYNLTEEIRLTAEAATSDTNFEGEDNRGEAYILEVEHQGEKLDGVVYYREQKAGFGLGQQSQSEEALRKIGTDTRYQFTDTWELDAELSQQKDLSTSRKREIAEARIEYDDNKNNYYAGLRTAKDSGGRANQEDEKSDQAIVGARKEFFDGDLTLSTDLEKSLSDNDNEQYPTRIRFGADYDITSNITLTADQEFARGEDNNEQTSLIGLTARPWSGMNIGTSLQQDLTEDGERVFANYGLFQNVELSPVWDVSFGVDRAQLINSTEGASAQNTNTEAELIEESDFNEDNINSEDFTAISMGANYNLDAWGWDSLLEYRTSESDDKWNLLSSAVHDLDNGMVMAGKAELRTIDSNIDSNRSVTSLLSFGYAYRPMDSRWIILDKFEFKFDQDISETGKLQSRRYINNTNANYLWDNDTQIALQYSFKYVLETIDSNDYDGFTDLMGAEIRHNLNPNWDVGMHANVLHSWDADVVDYSYGASVGYSPQKNVWVSLGYNVDGFDDEDFSGSEYTAKGVFLRFRIKADQETFKSIFGD